MTRDKKKVLPRRGQYIATVADHRDYVADHMYLRLAFEGEAAAVYGKARAGQFIQLACRDMSQSRNVSPLLRRPISIANVEEADGRCVVSIIYRIVGPGTQWLAGRRSGDLIDVLGPLGQPFKLPEERETKCILLGGGIGLPPLYFLAKKLASHGNRNRLALAGARGHTQMQGSFLMDRIDPARPLKPGWLQKNFNESETPSILATDDGSCGFHGTVVDALYHFLQENPDWKEAALFACGPQPMLRAVGQFSIEREMACQVCMEAYMSCGIGLCQSCAIGFNDLEDINASIKEEKKYKLVCVNGPVFNAWHVDWEEA